MNPINVALPSLHSHRGHPRHRARKHPGRLANADRHFPNLNLPVIYVIQAYGGMDRREMEGLITNYYEYHFLYVSGIHHVESRNIQARP